MTQWPAEGDFTLDFFFGNVGAQVGVHRLREPSRECSDSSAPMQIRVQPTQKTTDGDVLALERSRDNGLHEFANPGRHPVNKPAHLPMY